MMVRDGEERHPAEYPEMGFIYAFSPDVNILKSLLLFFDGLFFVGDLAHRDMARNRRPDFFDPLLSSKLAHWWQPDDFFDQSYRNHYSSVITKVIEEGILDTKESNLEVGSYLYPKNFPLVWDDQRERTEDGLLTDPSRTGGWAGQPLFSLLKEKGLLKAADLPAGGPLIPAMKDAHLIDRRLRRINSALVGQFARTQASERLRVSLHPVDRRADILTEVLSMDGMPSKGNLIIHDLDIVGPSLELVALDDLLKFRDRYQEEHRAYMRELRRFIAEISVLPPVERASAMEDRRRELKKQATELSKLDFAHWQGSANFLLGIAGAAWSIASADLPSAGLALADAFLGILGDRETPGAFSYLAEVGRL